MENAKHDGNFNSTLIGVSSVDGVTPTRLEVDPATGRLLVDIVVNSYPSGSTAFSATERHTSAQTNNELVSAPGADLRIYLTDLIISNGATAGAVKIVEDPSGTPVTKVEDIFFAVNGGAVIKFKSPIKLTTNKGLGFTSTTVTTHSITVSGYVMA